MIIPKRLLKVIFAVATVAFFLNGTTAVHANTAINVPTQSFAAACDIPNAAPLGGILVPWYAYLQGDDTSGRCRASAATNPDGSTDLLKTVSLVGIAIIDLLTRISGLIALGFLIKGSILYITSQGSPEGVKAAKSTITNALIGFVIVLLAIGIVQFLGNTLK